MDALERYLALVDKFPDWFTNKGETGEIRIITDKERILKEQARIRARLEEAGEPASWIEIGLLAEDEWYYFLRDLVEFPDGRVGGYTRKVNRKSAEGGFNVILACVRDDKVLLIRKYRHENRGWGWEFPHGFGEPGVPALEMARTELREEVGVAEAEFSELTTLPEGTGGTTVFRVEIPQDAEIALDPNESIAAHRWLPTPQLDRLVKDGRIRDGYTLWAYAVLSSFRRSSPPSPGS